MVPDTVPWALAFSAELADLCDGRTSHTRPADLGFVVQSVWSNASSLAGRAPCQPAVAPLFAALVPRLSGHVTLPPALMAKSSMPPTGLVPGVTVAAGARVAVPIHVYADGPSTTTFKASAVEGGAGVTTAGLGLALARSDVRVGDDLVLNVTAPADFAGPTVVVLYLTGGALGETYTRWPLLVSP